MDRQIDRYLPLRPRDYLILLALAAEDLHGYALIRAVDQATNGRVRLDPANLYRALRRLEHADLVREAGHRAAGGPEDERRRYFSITSRGRKVVGAEAARQARMVEFARTHGILPGKERHA